jgi:hypothetical protein
MQSETGRAHRSFRVKPFGMRGEQFSNAPPGGFDFIYICEAHKSKDEGRKVKAWLFIYRPVFGVHISSFIISYANIFH